MVQEPPKTSLDELRIALRAETPNGRERLEKLRVKSLRAGELEVAALALWGIAQKEMDLGRRAVLQRRLAAEYPRPLALIALAYTEIALGKLAAARQAYRAALELTVDRAQRDAIRAELLEIDRACAGRRGAVRRLRIRRVEQERDLALARSRLEPQLASARLWRQRRNAARSGDEETATMFLGALVEIALHSGEPHHALRLARRLVSERRDVWTLERLGDAQRRAGLPGMAVKSYVAAAAMARRRGRPDQLAALEQKLDFCR